MSSEPNYSLWLMPDTRVDGLIKQEISKQSQANGGPLFPPHITLLPDIKGDKDVIMATTGELLKKLKKFRMNFLDVTAGESYHKCVYILCAKEQELVRAGHCAREMFNMEAMPFMPHLSLLYADISPEQRSQSAAEAVQRLYGEGSDYNTLLPDNGCTAVAVTLWYTPVEDKSLASWKQLAEWPLE